jgi:AraC family transcriptional regulator
VSSKEENNLYLHLLTDLPGEVEAPAMPNTVVILHVGAAVQLACRRSGRKFRGLAVHGDIDVIPAETPSFWEIAKRNTEMIVSLSPALMRTVGEELDLDPARIEIRDRFQIRDPHLENIGWAFKSEMETGYSNGRLYLESLATATASRLLTGHNARNAKAESPGDALSGRRLKQALSFIEDNLNRNPSLAEIAAAAGLSVSHFKPGFRAATGFPVHEYVIRRRIDRAKTLLGESDLAISQIALETGFAHQSHLAYHMRRILGVAPKTLRETLR